MSVVAAADRLVTLPQDVPELTLGWEAVKWVTKYLRQPNGAKAGERFELINSQLRFLLHWYSVNPDGSWVYHHGVRRLSKGPIAHSTPVATPDGWCKHGDLRVGDRVYAVDGSVTVVEELHPVVQESCYEIRFSDGESIVCTGSHRWPMDEYVDNGWVGRVVTVEDMLAAGLGRWRSPASPVLEGVEAVFPLPPYLLGWWLGCGDADAPRITTGKFLLLALLDELDRLGVDHSPPKPNGGRTHRMRFGKGSAKKALREAGLLSNKHIPARLLKSSPGQRWELLAGLVDSFDHFDLDGHLEFHMRPGGLADDILDLLVGLGLMPTRTEGDQMLNGHSVGHRTRIRFAPQPGEPVTRLRQDRLDRTYTDRKSRTVVSVTPVETVPARCIRVAHPSHQYLVGNRNVPTCNSGKSPFAAVMSLIELCAPVRLKDFDPTVPGGCVGKPVAMPLVQIAATAESQPLALDTPVRTTAGWSTIGDLRVGDEVFGSSGDAVEVARLTEVWLGQPCYRVHFDDGESIVASGSHGWTVERLVGDEWEVVTLTTVELGDELDVRIAVVPGQHLYPYLYVFGVEPVESVPVKCIGIDNDDHLFGVGRRGVLTHNTANTQRMVRAFAPKGSRVCIDHQLEFGRTRYNMLPEGALEVITSSSSAAEGAEATHITGDETEWWVPGNGGPTFAATLLDNLTKSGNRLLETCNSWKPGIGSVAEESYEAWLAQEEGKTRNVSRILYDARIASPDTDMADEASLKAALEHVYGDCWWVDVRPIMTRIWDPKSRVDDVKRKYLNWPTVPEGAWADPQHWARMADPLQVIADQEQIVMFFDGSKSRDATALMGCRVSDGHVFTLGVWETDNSHDSDSVVPVEEIDATVERAFDRFEIVAFFADVKEWEGFTKVTWPQRYKDRLTLWAVPSGKSPEPIAWDMRSHTYDFVMAAELCEADIRDNRFTHDGNSVVARHVRNARRADTRWGITVKKESPDSPDKIDACVCVIGVRMVWRLVQAAVSKGKQRTGKVW